MTKMTGPDCAVMCILINTHTQHTHKHTTDKQEEQDVNQESGALWGFREGVERVQLLYIKVFG